MTQEKKPRPSTQTQIGLSDQSAYAFPVVRVINNESIKMTLDLRP